MTDRKFRRIRVLPFRVHLKRGSYSGRWEIYLDDKHIGWTIKQEYYQDHPGEWVAYAVGTASNYRGRHVDRTDKRIDAVMSVLFRAYTDLGLITLDEYKAMDDESWYLPEEVH